MVQWAKMKAQGPSNCWIWSGGLAARLGRDMARLSGKNGPFWVKKIDFFKISRNWWGIKGKVRRPKMKAQGPSNCWIWSGGLAARLDRDMARLCGGKMGHFGVKKSIFFEISRNWWGIKGKVRRPKMKTQGPSNRWIWSGGLAAWPGRDIAQLSEKMGHFRVISASASEMKKQKVL